MSLAEEIGKIAREAKEASRDMARAQPAVKNDFLALLSSAILQGSDKILAANRRDLEEAAQAGMDEARLDRLRLTREGCEKLAASCLEVAAMADPVGATEEQWQRPNGMLVGKMRIPLGVICMIYEARPGVTIEASILALKAGNAIILRGGKEALGTNVVLADMLNDALVGAGLPGNAVRLVQSRDRATIPILCKLDNFIDLMIPRGGEGLIRMVVEEASMPVLMHYKGVCHCYVDQGADLDMALDIVENSKTQRPGVCNALECLLVNRAEAGKFLPMLALRLEPHKVEFRADTDALPLLGPNALPMGETDPGTEYLGPILAVKLVADMDEAIAWITRYGSGHTDVICTSDYPRAMRFVREVDSSLVGVNVSTRFNDGGQLGLGAEIGISTTKFHAYGPMGLRELTASKFVVLGNGQIRA